ncbi:MAG TPA: polysaccharide pyruvyl transferase family protein [Trebonia sp.]|nr:polysaccharide pyruvyl transferase family protein [Trebonia sp.]
MRARLPRVLVAGWPSFIHGEATAGDVLAMEAVAAEIDAAGVPCDIAWSPVFRPGERTLDDADPARYSHLVFACGPLSGRGIEVLHQRFAACRRVAVGVSVIDPADPAAAGFHAILARDSPGAPATGDLAAGPRPPLMPVAGVIHVGEQREYVGRGRHATVSRSLAGWLPGCGCALLPLETRLDSRDWRLCGTPAELESILSRVDLVITMRMHGLVLALKHGVPALAVDPVAGGAKVTAQAQAWRWPAVVAPGAGGTVDTGAMDRWRDWCLSEPGRRAARRAAQSPPRSPLAGLIPELVVTGKPEAGGIT